MSVRINSPVIVNFTVKTLIETYPVAPNITVQSGELLYFHEEDGITYVTNQITGDGEIVAIAMNARTYPENVSCYMIIYRARHNDLSKYPHVLLSQFKHIELSRMYIEKQISTSCDAVSRQSCDLLSKYTCGNLELFGVREYPNI